METNIERNIETRVAVIAIIVEGRKNVPVINGYLHEFSEHIIGRMGIPYREKNINIISIILDAPGDAISALAGRIGRLDDVSVKTVYSK